MFGYGPDGWWDHVTNVLAAIGSFFAGLLLFLIWLAVIILFVRFLLVATRAAKVYLRNNGEHDGVLPQRGWTPGGTTATSAAPAATTPATTATRTRTPKVP